MQTEFGLLDGLADTSTAKIEWDTGQPKLTKKGKPTVDGKNALIKKEVHRVQILDPATGTGTFLAEVIKQIAPKIKGVAPGMWSGYIESDLMPRIHGFEILMASYAMCHLKLDMVLTDLGYTPSPNPPRQSIYLTNSLEEGEPPQHELPFSRWLATEVKGANTVKRDMPIMCVIGNPPYNPSSNNTSQWILDQLTPYKRGLGERKVNLDDDYIKFLRLAESFIENNDHGIVAMVTNNSFLDGTSHRLMRKHLSETFDSIFIVNLHGDIRNESTGGESDENVFDITQGVAISVMVRNQGNSEAVGKLKYYEFIGSRAKKYERLEAENVTNLEFEEWLPTGPGYLFKPQTSENIAVYEKGFSVKDFFILYSSGMQTKRDKLSVGMEKDQLNLATKDFRELGIDDLRAKYSLPKDGRDWTVASAKDDIERADGRIIPFLYKPFDIRYTYYSGRTKGFVAYPRREVMQHVVGRENFALITNRQNVRDYFSFACVTQIACNHGTFYLGNRGQDYCFPLYLYPEEDYLQDTKRQINFDQRLYARLRKLAEHRDHGTPDEVAIFDYIYGVLHCRAYRETYADLLKADFPRIPWPASADEFWHVSTRGETLRKLHLMEPTAVGAASYPFEGDGDNVVGTIGKNTYRDGKVWINKNQYFADVPQLAWNFYMGGYQPAQKWLKDRKDRALKFDDVRHYQRIIKVLAETDRVMSEIDMTLEPV
ncbi:MAG: type ISP restriction/modification enzyme [Salinisphaeraceae bacterium]